MRGPGCRAGVPPPGVPDYPVELALFYDAPAGLTVDGRDFTGRGFLDGIGLESEFESKDGDAYVSVAYAGPKLSD